MLSLALNPNPVEVPDLPALYSEALKTFGTQPRRPDGRVHCSSLTRPDQVCLKRLQFEGMWAEVHENAAPIGLLWALLKGGVGHEALDNLVQYMPHRSEAKVRVLDEELNLAGELDQYLRYKGHLWVVDHKTLSPAHYKYITKPVTKHIYQVHGYMIMTGARHAIMYYVPLAPLLPSRPDEILGELQRVLPAGHPGTRALEELERWLKEAPVRVKQEDDEEDGNQLPGKQFVIDYNETIARQIREMLVAAKEATAASRWLPTRPTKCTLCPYSRPCFANTPVVEVQRVEGHELLMETDPLGEEA